MMQCRARHAVLGACAFFLVGAGLVGCASSTDDGPAPPELVSAEKMAEALHLSWVNREARCESLELERRTPGPDGELRADFTLLYTLPGAADNKHDATATEDLAYIYRLRCRKGGRYSAYSNELTANPRR